MRSATGFSGDKRIATCRWHEHLYSLNRWRSSGALLFVILGLSSAHAEQDDLQELRSAPTNIWRLVREDRVHDIQMFIKHEDDKPYRSFRVTAELNCDVQTLYRVLMDFPSYPKWYWQVKSIRLLARPTPKDYFIYMVHRAPFDLRDRDVILHATLKPGNDEKSLHVIGIEADPDFMEKQPPLIRMRAENMTIRFSRSSRYKTRVEAEGYIDPGSDAPSWTVNLIQRSAPYTNMLGLARMVQMPEYRDGPDFPARLSHPIDRVR